MGVHKEKIEKPFTITPSAIYRDPDLGMKERGMLSTLYDLPEDWRFSVEGMAKILKDGVSSVKTTMNELEKKGYVERKRNRTKEGWFSDEEVYLKLPSKMANAPPDGSPSDDYPPVVNPPVVSPSKGKPLEEKQGESNNNKSSIKESNNNRYSARRPAGRARTGRKKNSFNNFPQREYDYDDIEKKLLAAQFARWQASEPEDADVCTGQEKQADRSDDTETAADAV